MKDNQSVSFRLADIPQACLDTVRLDLENYLVPILGSSVSDGVPTFALIGSGTLIRINAAYCILTAAHVWRITAPFDNLYFVISKTPSAFSIPRRNIVAKEDWDDQKPEWGPDLALLEIPAADGITIEAKKSFLNLKRQRTMLLERPPAIEKGMWAVTGVPAELGTVDISPEHRRSTYHFRGRAFFGTLNRSRDHDGYDYLDIGADVALPDVPQSFGGVSGGGLWQVHLSMGKKSRAISWNGERYFRGVAFWESSVAGRRRVIRCHGPTSIFDIAWKKWGLSKPPAPVR